jgi:metal-responsive CopG/Arc/MetJ family transcriptional regulator
MNEDYPSDKDWEEAHKLRNENNAIKKELENLEEEIRTSTRPEEFSRLRDEYLEKNRKLKENELNIIGLLIYKR